jgi:hypothetical protein
MRYKLFLLITISFICISSPAQFKKGMRMVGATIGSVLYNSGNSDITVAQVGSSSSKLTSFNLNINPTLGWFISTHTVIGASLIINPSTNKTTYEQNSLTYQSDKNNNFNIGVGGFVRHYFGETPSLRPFGQLGINGGISNLKTEGFGYYANGAPLYKYTYTGNSTGGTFLNSTFQLGATKMVNDHTGLDFYIGYNFSYTKSTFKRTTLFYASSTDNNPSTGKNEVTTKFTNHGFLLGVGFQIFLDPRK